jgi:hypothetical protein
MVLVPRTAQAGPYLGDWAWCWKPTGDCAPNEYSFLHYWARDLYILRSWFKPSYLDQFAPGLPVPVVGLTLPANCRSIAPMPSFPYASPAAYFGRAVLPDTPATTEKKEGTSDESARSP